MTDRELLELAAKAIEIEYSKYHQNGWLLLKGLWFDGRNWNPLEDDGDALRLAVAIGATVSQQPTYVCVMLPHGPTAIRGIAWTEPHNNDPYAATRRAIVRAAANIGKYL